MIKGIDAKIISGDEKIAIIGLGYVGMPLAGAFSKKASVIGFDIDKSKVENYLKGIEPTGEVGTVGLKAMNIDFTYDKNKLDDARFYIITVPTPILEDKTPDLRCLLEASKIVGRHIRAGSIVVYESTVYPGVTEEICAPIIERTSGLICGNDFWIGYSPERINPGDKQHTLTSVVKVVSGMDSISLDIISNVYSMIAEAGVYKAKSIKVAEAAKVIENSQRDINIAFMNELSMIFNLLDISIEEVLKTAETKWNFIPFCPGLVGGHCIGVDPYYLAYKAQAAGYHPQIILAGRRINDGMGKYVAENTIKQMILAGKRVKGAKVLIMGITFKENVPDVRNSKVIDIINHLKSYAIEILVSDPIANSALVKEVHGIELTNLNKNVKVDAIVLAVGHDDYKRMGIEDLEDFFEKDGGVLIDIKGLFNKDLADEYGYYYWRL